MNNSIIKVVAATEDADIQEMVDLANGQERLATYNALTGKTVKKFSTKASGIKQTVRALVKERDRLREGGPSEDFTLEQELSHAAKERLGGARHDPAKYRSSFLRQEMTKGRTDYDELVQECEERFPHLKTTRRYVLWHRWQFRKEGLDV